MNTVPRACLHVCGDDNVRVSLIVRFGNVRTAFQLLFGCCHRQQVVLAREACSALNVRVDVRVDARTSTMCVSMCGRCACRCAVDVRVDVRSMSGKNEQVSNEHVRSESWVHANLEPLSLIHI